MPEDPKPAREPETDELLEGPRTVQTAVFVDARAAEAAERASVSAEQAAATEREGDAEPDDAADKTDMSAVGDDGQVFGG